MAERLTKKEVRRRLMINNMLKTSLPEGLRGEGVVVQNSRFYVTRAAAEWLAAQGTDPALEILIRGRGGSGGGNGFKV